MDTLQNPDPTEQNNRIYIEGVIKDALEYDDLFGTQRFVSYDDVKAQLEALPPQGDITLILDSIGGNVYTGYRIFNLLANSGRRITVQVQSYCGSIATMIALAGHTVVMPEFSRFAVHDPYIAGNLMANAAELENTAAELRKIEDELVRVYMRKTGRPELDIRGLMAQDTELTAQEALQWGFVDKVTQPIRALAYFKKTDNTKMAETKLDDKQKTLLQNAIHTLNTYLKGARNEAAPAAAPDKGKPGEAPAGDAEAQLKELQAANEQLATQVEELVKLLEDNGIEVPEELKAAPAPAEGDAAAPEVKALRRELAGLKQALTHTFGKELKLNPQEGQLRNSRSGKGSDALAGNLRRKYGRYGK